MSLSIGADVGETDTTAVILKEKEVLCSYEVSTTQDVTSDMIDAIKLVLRQLPEEDAHNRDVLHEFFYLNGGCETDGTTHVDEDQLTQKTKEMYIEGITHIAIVGVYSPKYNDEEDHANRIISSTSPEMKITVSHKVCDEEDFLRRERLSIMNESLRPLCERTAETLSTALTDLGLKCPFYFTRSDGKLISFEDTQRFPMLTLASGLTNSMRGAAFLTGVENGIVIDIGGTTIHVGSIKDGFPKHLSGKERALEDVKKKIQAAIDQAKTEPFIDPETGDWILKKYEYTKYECITLGAGIMACGGLGTVPEVTGPAAIVALMGDPLIIPERLISGLESTSALKKMEEGHCPGNEVKAMEVGDQLTNAFLDR
ncbi:putative D-/L-hydantoinase subunit A [Acropora cervicornis]|uniref:D-/L-hydantoinase subunit A n=1 Tax=Acropora cervicornis TaxID=6130 RepID=A0AAD9Q1A7_ACRCE|nr:putative D-/L-hydantoinase subunit A [Acropora cervicornis]